MSRVLGPDGRPIVEVAGDGKTRCVLCVVQEPVDTSKVARVVVDDDDNERLDERLIEVEYEDGLVHGYAIGVQLLATVLLGCGLDLEKAVHVQEVASSLCASHTKLTKEFLDENKHKDPVERAVANLKAASTFFVGRGPGGGVRGVGP